LALSAANISTQDIQFKVLVNARTWRWTTRVDLSGLGPTFQIVDIVTPFGFLRDSIPLPGDVVQAMSDSITSLKANFKPAILVGPPTSLVFSVDEGRGFSLPQSGVLTNSGVYGSLLNGALTVSAPYVHVTPPTVGGLAFNESGSFEVSVDSTDLLTSSSPYHEVVTVQDPSAPNSPRTLPITINVRPRALISVSPATVTFNVSAPLSGPYPLISSQSFNVTNTGPSGSVLDFQVARLTGLSQAWLSRFVPMNAVLDSGISQAVSVYVAPPDGFLPGTYTETLRISGYSSNEYADVVIQLVIT
jgi:hypothetical protein